MNKLTFFFGLAFLMLISLEGAFGQKASRGKTIKISGIVVAYTSYDEVKSVSEGPRGFDSIVRVEKPNSIRLKSKYIKVDNSYFSSEDNYSSVLKKLDSNQLKLKVVRDPNCDSELSSIKYGKLIFLDGSGEKKFPHFTATDEFNQIPESSVLPCYVLKSVK